jgi:DNA-binding transcriptional regulator YiaG
MVHLYENGVREGRTVHRVVAEAFIGPRPEGLEVRHLDGNKTNNRASNLVYSTHKENEADKARHGTLRRGEANAAAKLTAADVREIRRRKGERQEDLAAEYGCTFSNISAIQRGKSWRHV